MGVFVIHFTYFTVKEVVIPCSLWPGTLQITVYSPGLRFRVSSLVPSSFLKTGVAPTDVPLLSSTDRSCPFWPSLVTMNLTLPALTVSAVNVMLHSLRVAFTSWVGPPAPAPPWGVAAGAASVGAAAVVGAA